MSIAHILQDLWANHRKIKMIDTGKKTGFYYENKTVKKRPDMFKGEHLFQFQT